MLSTLPKEITILFPFYDTDNQHYNIHVISEYWNFLILQNNRAIVTALSTVGLNQFPKPNFGITVMQAFKSFCLYISQDNCA